MLFIVLRQHYTLQLYFSYGHPSAVKEIAKKDFTLTKFIRKEVKCVRYVLLYMYDGETVTHSS